MFKALIMLVRVLALAAIVLGGLLWTTGHEPYMAPHIGIGFCVMMLVFVMAVIALTKKALIPGLLGILLALLLPLVGMMQLPLVPHILGIIQVAHIVIAISVIGVAERLYSAIQRAG